MSGRITFLLKNIAVVCESPDLSVKNKKSLRKIDGSANGLVDTYVIPVTLCFSDSKSAKTLAGSLLWNDLFDRKRYLE